MQDKRSSQKDLYVICAILMSYIMAQIIPVLCVIKYLIPFHREQEQAINKGCLNV